MVLRRRKLSIDLSTEVLKQEKKEEKVSAKKLPADTYKDEIPQKEIVVDESKKIVVSIKRDGEFGLPHVDIRYFATTENYTGFTKKGINIPLEFTDLLVDALYKAYDEYHDKVDRKKLKRK